MENGLQTAEYYRHSQKKFADTLCKAEIGGLNLHDAAPVPAGMALSWLDSRLALTLTEDWSAQYRRVCGYIGEIKLLPTRITH